MKNIVLIGMPGSGKTTFGRALSRELNRPFVDADDYLEEREGRTISSFFAESEKAFRDAEERTIRELADRQGIVISTGGGVVKRTANVENLRRNGLILLIDRPVDDIVNDVEVEKKAERFGTLFAAGLIVGESLMGVILAFIIAASVTSGGSEAPLALALENWDKMGELLGLAVFIFGIFIFVSRVLRAKKSK